MKRNDMNDFDFIKDKFEKTYPATPDGLSEDAINQLLLSKQESKIIKLKPRNNVRAIVSAVAGLILVLGIIYAAYISGMFPGNNNKVGTFENYNEVNISSTFSDNDSNKGISDSYNGIYAALDSIIGRVGWFSLEGMGGPDAVLQTNNKDDDVQEPDEIKTDGEYIYRIYHKNAAYDDYGITEKEQNRIYILKTDNGEAELVSVINYEYETLGETYTDSFSVCMRDLYVYNDRLIVEIEIRDIKAADEYLHDFRRTVTQIYDISDRSDPKLISEFEQSGYRASSQMIDNYLYTVSYYYAPKERDERAIPSIGKLNEAKPVPAQNIDVFEDSDDSNFIVVTAIDVENAEITDSKAVLGAKGNVFFSGNNLFILGLGFLDGDGLNIIKAELNEETVEFTEKARVSGSFDDSIELAEVNGLLIILESQHSETDKVYILNENFEMIGKNESLSSGEEITVASIIGDAIYMSTHSADFNAVEHKLRVVDFSDPEKPVERCAVFTDASITSIIPVDDEQMICLGYDRNTESQVIILYDISDKAEPKILDRKDFNDDIRLNIYGNYVVNAEKGYISISCSYYYEDEKSGVVTIEVANDKIRIVNLFANESIADNVKWLYINDYLYSFEFNDEEPFNKAFVISSHKYE